MKSSNSTALTNAILAVANATAKVALEAAEVVEAAQDVSASADIAANVTRKALRIILQREP